ncbi:MAG: glycosyltransferase family 9 protein [Deltaproteobacteria bacterium]|nr:glycosyltransferase family 9 protein [Deltaproteobacteria bacterium]
MNRSIRYLKRTDDLFGPFLLKLSATLKREASPRLSMQGTKRLLIIRPGGIGDAALLMPSLKILRETLPEAKIHILCEPRNLEVFLNSPFVDRILNYRKIEHIIRLKQTLYDIIFDTEQSHFLTGALVSMLNSRLKVGFATQGRESVYDLGVDYSHGQYEAESFFRLFSEAIETFAVDRKWQFPYFFPSNEAVEKVDALVGEVKSPIVCLFPGASIKERLWPADRWAKVVAELWGGRLSARTIRGESRITTLS